MEKYRVARLKPAFSDTRGKIFDVFDGENIRHIGHIISKKGSIRGNHYHKKAAQWTYILKGKVRWVIRDIRKINSRPRSRILGPGDLAVDAPYVAHAMAALTDAEFIFFTNKRRFGSTGYEKDTFRVTLV